MGRFSIQHVNLLLHGDTGGDGAIYMVDTLQMMISLQTSFNNQLCPIAWSLFIREFTWDAMPGSGFVVNLYGILRTFREGRPFQKG